MATYGKVIEHSDPILGWTNRKPEWLRNGDKILWTGVVSGEAASHVCKAVGAAWFNFRTIQLDAEHYVYTVQAYNEKHGTSFYPWGGGDEAPDDWDGGAVLWLDGMSSVPISPSSPSFIGWTKRVGFSTNSIGDHIIGYTRRSEPVATDTVQITRMTGDQWAQFFSAGEYGPYYVEGMFAVLDRLNLVIPEPTEAERIAATTGLTVEQVQAVLDAR